MSNFYQDIVALMQGTQFDEAERRLTAHLKAQPGDVEALHLRALARGRLGQFEAGRADFLALEGRHPQPHAVYSNLGNLEVRAGRPDEAIAAYR